MINYHLSCTLSKLSMVKLNLRPFIIIKYELSKSAIKKYLKVFIFEIFRMKIGSKMKLHLLHFHFSLKFDKTS
jgi:hypothetical protein